MPVLDAHIAISNIEFVIGNPYIVSTHLCVQTSKRDVVAFCMGLNSEARLRGIVCEQGLGDHA